MKLVSEFNPMGKRVLVRVDWNITLGKAMQVVDDTRIKRTFETINYLRENGAKQIILMSHLGRPGGKIVPELSLAPVVEYAEKLIGEEIELVKELSNISTKRLVMLENLRFWEGEESNDDKFVQELVSLGDVYVNEAFGDCHREAASIVGIAKELPVYGGFDLRREIKRITVAVENPVRPLVVVMGGAKVKDKLKLLEVISHKADVLLLGGKLANSFMANGIRLMGGAKVIVPVEGNNLLDIGVETQEIFAKEIAKAGTVIWNGPMGMVEDERYRGGTHAIYEALVTKRSANVIVGGGDTLAAIRNEKYLERIDWISTGGGAMLQFLEKGTLPGIEVL